MRPAVVVIVTTLIGLTLTWPFLAGLVRSLRHIPGISNAVGVPRLDLDTSPSVATPGDVILVRVRSRDAETCLLGWRDDHARDIPGAEKAVSLDGTVQWRLRVPPGMRPGSRALVVTAQRGAVRTRIRIPVHVLAADAAAAHDEIPRLDLPEVPLDLPADSLVARTRRFGELTGLYHSTRARPSAQVPAVAARMLDASVTSSPDTTPALFEKRTEATETSTGTDHASAAS